jgi:hypothetical protein
MFFVIVLVLNLYFSSWIKIETLEILETRDNATYSWPCEKTGCGKYIPTNFIVCPCALFMVIANAGRIGNCRRLISNGN